MSDPRPSQRSLIRPAPPSVFEKGPPSKAPAAVTPPAESSRRWLISVGAAAAALLGALIVGQVYLFKMLSRRAETGQPAGPQTAAPATDGQPQERGPRGRPAEPIVRGNLQRSVETLKLHTEKLGVSKSAARAAPRTTAKAATKPALAAAKSTTKSATKPAAPSTSRAKNSSRNA